jgi:tetratricopeptide (TPR) repeat protein
LPRDGYVLLAQLEYSFENLDGAIRVLEDWADQQPDDREARRLLAERLFEAGRHEDAAPHYEALADGGDVDVLNTLAWIYNEQEDERAEATARRAYDLAPERFEVEDTLGWILAKKGEYKEAAGLLKSALATSLNHPIIAYHLAVALHGLGDTAGARSALEQSLESKGDFPGRDKAEALLASLEAESDG